MPPMPRHPRTAILQPCTSATGPKANAPAKLLARGAGSLSDAELLAIFLGSGTAGRTPSARRDPAGGCSGLRGLLDREPKALVRQRDRPARACLLAGGGVELGTGTSFGSWNAARRWGPAAAGRYFAQRLRGLGHEVFAVLCTSTPATAPWASRNCSAAGWMAPKSTHAPWSSALWRTAPRR